MANTCQPSPIPSGDGAIGRRSGRGVAAMLSGTVGVGATPKTRVALFVSKLFETRPCLRCGLPKDHGVRAVLIAALLVSVVVPSSARSDEPAAVPPANGPPANETHRGRRFAAALERGSCGTRAPGWSVGQHCGSRIAVNWSKAVRTGNWSSRWGRSCITSSDCGGTDTRGRTCTK